MMLEVLRLISFWFGLICCCCFVVKVCVMDIDLINLIMEISNVGFRRVS